MERERAEMSSVSAAVAEAHDRVGQTAEHLQQTGHEALAADLFEVERALSLAARRLEAVVASMT